MIIIGTSDRGLFKGCRRRWDWQSPLRQGRHPHESVLPLWLGSGIHFALEDYHGYNSYRHPAVAFEAYVTATTKDKARELPYDYLDGVELGIDMMDYYADEWLLSRDPLNTFWFNDKPQVEVTVHVPLPGFENLTPFTSTGEYEELFYRATFDRVAIDLDGFLWLVEYKTAARFETFHLDTDPQVSAYCWLMSKVYDTPIAGVVYQQHLKRIPEAPYILANGNVSTNKSQHTTHKLYREALVNLYGDISRANRANIETLNHLAALESEDADRYIRRDRIHRSSRQIASEENKVRLEIPEMLDPNLPIYPHPTRMGCEYCNFKVPCISLDDGSDWEFALNEMSTPEEEDRESWRKYLPTPTDQHEVLV